MIKRTVEISREAAHLSVKLDQLQIEPRGESVREPVSIPCEDVGVVLVDHPATTYSHAALSRMAEFGAVLVVCGPDHLPAAMMVPMASHSEVVWRLREQIGVGKPLHKRIWKQIVVAKIRAQAANLEEGSTVKPKLLNLAREVRSGDPANVEAQAARLYWSAWLTGLPSAESFRRDPDGPGINSLLNYGYAVIRAAVARAIVAAGLHPTLGIRHSNRSNTFCLADDLVEPIRPFVDARVRDLYRESHETLDQPTKAALLQLLTAMTTTGDQTGPLMVGLHRMVASLVRCYQGKETRLLLPVAVRD